MAKNVEEIVKKGFSAEKRRLNVDYFNAFVSLKYWSATSEFEKMQPLETYEEYFNKYYPNVFVDVMDLSNLEIVIIINRLVNTFNSDLERIKKEKDSKAVKGFLLEIDYFMRPKEN